MQYNFGTRPLAVDTLAEMPEAEKCMCLTLPPIRARNRREEKRDGGLPRFWNTKLLFQFFRFVLFFLPFRVVKDTELQLHPRYEEVFRLRRL